MLIDVVNFSIWPIFKFRQHKNVNIANFVYYGKTRNQPEIVTLLHKKSKYFHEVDIDGSILWSKNVLFLFCPLFQGVGDSGMVKHDKILTFSQKILSGLISQILKSLRVTPANMWMIHWSADSAHLHLDEQNLLPWGDKLSPITLQALNTLPPHPAWGFFVNIVPLTSSHVVELSTATTRFTSGLTQWFSTSSRYWWNSFLFWRGTAEQVLVSPSIRFSPPEPERSFRHDKHMVPSS